MEEVLLRLEELLFPSIADMAVLSVDVNDETVLIEARSTVAEAVCPGCGSGVVEVHVNRIKMLKRQMFGRAGFDLLRKRVPLSR